MWSQGWILTLGTAVPSCSTQSLTFQCQAALKALSSWRAQAPAPRAGRGRCSLLRAQGHRRHSPGTPREAAAAAAPEPQERERRAAASARSRTER